MEGTNFYLALVAFTAMYAVSSVTGLMTGPTCVETCEGRADGNYQSCQGCTVFATCSHGSLYDGRPCADGTVWDDRVDFKKCIWRSRTCVEPKRKIGSNSLLTTTIFPSLGRRTTTTTKTLEVNEVVEETSGDVDQLQEDGLILVS